MTTSSCAIALVVAAGAVLAMPSAAHASCVPHEVRVEPSQAPAGAEVTITGVGWFVGCNDTGQGVPEPADTADLSVTQAGKTFPLGRVNADERYTFSTTVRLPAELRTGEATVIGQGRGGQASAVVVVSRASALPQTGAEGPLSALGAAALLAAATALASRPSRPSRSR